MQYNIAQIQYSCHVWINNGQKHRKMAKEKFKYKINDQIALQPRHITIDAIIGILSDHGISRDTFYRDRNVLIEDDFSIPSERLDVYAQLFGVTTDELKNYTPKKIKPLSERKQSELAKTIIKKSKLTKG